MASRDGITRSSSFSPPLFRVRRRSAVPASTGAHAIGRTPGPSPSSSRNSTSVDCLLDGRRLVATESPHPYFQSDANLSSIILDEMNAGLLKSFLYFDDSRELPFLNAFVSFNALQGRQAQPGAACKLGLAPA